MATLLVGLLVAGLGGDAGDKVSEADGMRVGTPFDAPSDTVDEGPSEPHAPATATIPSRSPILPLARPTAQISIEPECMCLGVPRTEGGDAACPASSSSTSTRGRTTPSP